MENIEKFLKDRAEAFLSLDREKIMAYLTKYSEPESDFHNRLAEADDELFWRSVHKAITGCTDFPIEFRRKSKDWLTQRGSASFDDGDL